MEVYDNASTERTVTSPLDARIPPPVMTLVTGIAMVAASWLVPPTALPDAIRVGAIVTALLIAGVIGGRAFRAFASAGTTINPVAIETASSLVTTGIYRVSRNPMYVSLTTLLVALSLSLSNLWLLVGPLFFALYITRFQIVPEERVMSKKFGSAFEAYRKQVRRWL